MAARQGPNKGRRPAPSRAAEDLAQRLHAAAIHLLRRLRAEDDASGLTAPRLSALSVLVFGGPRSIGELAAAEQVRPPTISRLVRELERAGLVRRAVAGDDRRRIVLTPTAKGTALLQQGRRRRVELLARGLEALPPKEQQQLAETAELLHVLLPKLEITRGAAPRPSRSK